MRRRELALLMPNEWPNAAMTSILVARRRDRLEDVAKRIEIKTKRTIEIVTADLADAKDLLRIEALLTERRTSTS